nr:protein RST1 isoform X1 [Ipomoea batatas]
MALLGQWMDELEAHSKPDSISVFVHYGGDISNDPRVIAEPDVVLTTYGLLTAAYKADGGSSIFHKVDWHRIVLDEAHTIKSWRTMSARAAFTLSVHCRWSLTGTPLQNNVQDLYSLMCFLHVEPWCNWAWWNELIQRPYENGDQRASKLIKAILRQLMLSRTKEIKDKEGRFSRNSNLFSGGRHCKALPLSDHAIKSTASKFLLSWLFQHEHEYRQWSAAISLGLISSFLHVTDRKQKVEYINALLERVLQVLSVSKSTLVKGACGVGLGFSCQDLLTKSDGEDNFHLSKGALRMEEIDLLKKIIGSLSKLICPLTQSSDVLINAFSWRRLGSDDFDSNITPKFLGQCSDDFEEDVWGVAGLILGLGSSVGAICRADLLTKSDGEDNFHLSKGALRMEEIDLLKKIIGSLSKLICPLTQSSDVLINAFSWRRLGSDDFDSNITPKFLGQCSDDFEEDVWGVAGLILGLGSSVGAICRAGFYDAVLNLETLLFSWIPNLNPSIPFLTTSAKSELLFSVGACLAAPIVMAGFLSQSRTDGCTLHQSLLIASCIGAGSLLGTILNGSLHSLKVEHVKDLPALFRKSNSDPNPPLIHLGATIGTVNALGAGAGTLIQDHPSFSSHATNNQKESSYINGPLLSSPALEPDLTSLVQEIFLVAQNPDADQLRSSMLHGQLHSLGILYNCKEHYNEATTTGNILHVNTISVVLRCLEHAPRLPSLDWVAIIGRFMRYESEVAELLSQDEEHHAEISFMVSEFLISLLKEYRVMGNGLYFVQMRHPDWQIAAVKEFEELYTEYERKVLRLFMDSGKAKKVVQAQNLWFEILKSQIGELGKGPLGLVSKADTFILLGMAFYSPEVNYLDATAQDKEIFETIYYHVLKASSDLALQRKTLYETYEGSPISNGTLQPDMWAVTPSNQWDWVALRAMIEKNEVMNSLLAAPMPTASTSQILGNN